MVTDNHQGNGDTTGQDTSLAGMQPHEILNALANLERALAEHAEWLKNWHLAVVCADSPDKPAINGTFDPHRPSFELWVDGEASVPFRELPTFEAISASLAKMFRQSKVLTRAAKNNKGIPSGDYDLFMNSAIHLNELVRQLQTDTWNRLASVDPLTGVRNRNTMMTVMDAERSRSERTSQPCTLALMDLDHFKDINDTFGHPNGDTVLKSIADMVVSSLRPYDQVFRYGGDEFLICLPNTDAKTAHLVLDRLREHIAQTDISLSNGDTCRQTVSIGIAPITADDSIQDAVQHTDDALYNVKNTGRNAVVIANIA